MLILTLMYILCTSSTKIATVSVFILGQEIWEGFLHFLKALSPNFKMEWDIFVQSKKSKY